MSLDLTPSFAPRHRLPLATMDTRVGGRVRDLTGAQGSLTSMVKEVQAGLDVEMTEHVDLNLDDSTSCTAKTLPVACSHKHECLDVLPIRSSDGRLNRRGALFASFSPPISSDAAKEIRRTIRSCRLHLASGLACRRDRRKDQLGRARLGSTTTVGFWASELSYPGVCRINEYVVRRAMGKYKRQRRRPTTAW